MAFVYLKDTSGEVVVLNTDLISYVAPKVKGNFDQGAGVYLKQTIGLNQNVIHVSGEEAQELFNTILG